ncbi:MAG: hypothetical protein IPG69_04825 [Flavobacteriales bacterium]|nr:hypothetical protein [Flavobacteriales bacterium]
MAQAVRVTKANALFCLEPTGHYGYLLVEELMRPVCRPGWHIRWTSSTASEAHGVRTIGSMPSALPIMPVGTDKARLLGPGSLRMNKLKQLLTCRRQLVTDKRRHQVRIKDLNRHVDDRSELCSIV